MQRMSEPVSPAGRPLWRYFFILVAGAFVASLIGVTVYVTKSVQQAEVVKVLKKLDVYVEYYDEREQSATGEFIRAKGGSRSFFPEFIRKKYPSFCSRIFGATAYATHEPEGFDEDRTRRFFAAVKRLQHLRHFGIKSNFVTSQQLRELPSLAKLQDLYLEGASFGDDGLAVLAECGEMRGLTLIAPKMTDAGLKQVNELKKLKSLSLSSPLVTDSGLSQLQVVRQLEELILHLPAATDTGVLALPTPAKLTSLVLLDLQLTDAGVSHLVSGGQLEQFRIRGGSIGDDHLAALGKNKNFRYRLHLAGRPITDKGLSHVAGLVNLGAIDLSDTQVTDAGLVHLNQMMGLQYVILQNASITGEGLKQLPRRYVRELDLSGTTITDESIAHLVGMNRLQSLFLRNTPISGRGLEALRLLSVRVLDLQGAALTSDGIASLAGLNGLEEINLSHTPFDDEACQHLPILRDGDRKLDLSHTRITDASVPAIIRTKAHELILDNTLITDKGLVGLADLLQDKLDTAKISLKGTKVTVQGVRQLHEIGDKADKFFQITSDLPDSEIYPGIGGQLEFSNETPTAESSNDRASPK